MKASTTVEPHVMNKMKDFLMRTLFLSLALIIIALPALAKLDPVADVPAETKKIEAYLDTLKTAQARFVQTTHDGTQLVGTFYLERPGKLRFQYDPPIEDFVVADGFFIYFYDAELGEQTNAPIGQTLADFLLRGNIKLSDDVTVESIKRGGGYLQVELTQTADPAAGTLMMAFTEEPFQLKKWRVIDAQGLITEVELFYLKSGITHPSGLFTYKDPNKERGGYND